MKYKKFENYNGDRAYNGPTMFVVVEQKGVEYLINPDNAINTLVSEEPLGPIFKIIRPINETDEVLTTEVTNKKIMNGVYREYLRDLDEIIEVLKDNME